MRPFVPLVALALSAPAAAQQVPDDGSLEPEGWEILTDRVSADPDEIHFAPMEPGFHIETGPAALFYAPDATARGTFRLEATIHLLRPSDGNEPYGVFIGGEDLLGSYQRYTTFLVRQTGEYLVRHRLSATSTEDVVGWTTRPAIRAWSDASEPPVNVLIVEVGPDELVFHVNDEEVSRVPRGNLATDGVVGIRVSEGLGVHVSRFWIAR